MQNLGFVINLKKSQLTPVKKIEILGLIINSRSMTLALCKKCIIDSQSKRATNNGVNHTFRKDFFHNRLLSRGKSKVHICRISITVEYLPNALNYQADWLSRSHLRKSSAVVGNQIQFFSQVLKTRGVPQVDLFTSG